YHEMGQNNKTVSDATKAIEISPKYADAYNTRGVGYLNLKNYDLALADFNKAIEIDSTFSFAYYNIALIYLRAGQYEKAEAEIQTFLNAGGKSTVEIEKLLAAIKAAPMRKDIR
ncbi:MAG: tetratricopeptide repeat protein, partial [Chloroflexota bacterium]